MARITKREILMRLSYQTGYDFYQAEMVTDDLDPIHFCPTDNTVLRMLEGFLQIPDETVNRVVQYWICTNCGATRINTQTIR